MIEVAAARAGHVRIDGVEDLAALLVGIESFVYEMPEKTSALRDAEPVGALRRGHSVRIVFAVCDEIANCGKTASDDCRILRGVNQLVDFSGNEAAVERN